MDDRIIDLTSRGARDTEADDVFALWGSEGERSRLALPVWRCIYLLDGDRGGIVRTGTEGGGDEEVRPFFVLDVGADPARTEFLGRVVESTVDDEPPSLRVVSGEAGVLLAREETSLWWLIVTGPDVGAETLDGGKREDLLFLAGECAGLLTHRGLARD